MNAVKVNSIRRIDIVWLALVAYVPFFLSSPGKISGDTKQYLYLDRLIYGRPIQVREQLLTKILAIYSRWVRTTGSWTNSVLLIG